MLEDPATAVGEADAGTVSIVFTDIEGSTARAVELGDVRWMEVLGAHNALDPSRALARHGGREVKAQGDGFMLSFPSARKALMCMIDVQRSLAAYGRSRPLDMVRVRAGCHTGEVILGDDGDLFGRHVVMAARIANLAARRRDPGVVARAGDRGVRGATSLFAPPRSVTLKGIDGTHLVHAVLWRERTEPTWRRLGVTVNMEFRVLGSIEACEDGRAIALGGPQQRRLLAVLLADAGRVVPVDRLVEAVWPGDERAGDGAAHDPHVRVPAAGRARRRLRRHPGARLPDRPRRRRRSTRVRSRSWWPQARARRADRGTSRRYDEALASWRGPAFAEFADEWWARPEAARSGGAAPGGASRSASTRCWPSTATPRRCPTSSAWSPRTPIGSASPPS